MPIKYEWTVEMVRRYDDGVTDILDYDFYDSYQQARRSGYSPVNNLNEHNEVGLVRYEYDSVDTLLNTTWAYMTGDNLPTHFKDINGCDLYKVPQRFFDEVARFTRK